MNATSAGRRARIERATNETTVVCEMDLDGGPVEVHTGLPFFDHMLDQLGRHSGFGFVVTTNGDLEVDSHHTVEDTALVVGATLAEALGNRAGVRRFASGLYPLDEAVVEVVLDLSGRPYCEVHLAVDDSLPLGIPAFNPQMAAHFFTSFATAAGVTLHVNQRSGDNTHHIIEAAFKGLARTLRDAVRVEGDQVPSTKGVL